MGSDQPRKWNEKVEREKAKQDARWARQRAKQEEYLKKQEGKHIDKKPAKYRPPAPPAGGGGMPPREDIVGDVSENRAKRNGIAKPKVSRVIADHGFYLKIWDTHQRDHRYLQLLPDVISSANYEGPCRSHPGSRIELYHKASERWFTLVIEFGADKNRCVTFHQVWERNVSRRVGKGLVKPPSRH